MTLRLPWSLLARLATVATLAACSPDLTLDDAVTVACAADQDCPPGRICRPEIGRCIPVAALDISPPALAAPPEVEPPAGGPGTVFEVRVTVDEELARPPELTVGGRALTLRGQEGPEFVFAYTPRGDEAEGSAPVTARLVDAAGNVADGVPCGTLVFDFTAPSVVPGSVRLEPEVVRAGETLQVAFTVDDPPAHAEVRLLERVARAAPAAAGDDALRFEVPIVGDEPEGEVPVRAWLGDAAGNLRAGVELGRAVLDFHAPVVTRQDVAREAVRPGEVIGVLLTFSEPTAEEPEVTMARGDGEVVGLERVVVSPVASSYRHTARADDHGDWAITLGPVADAAGNRSEPVVVGRVRVDAVPPALVGGEVRLLDGGARRAGQPVRVAFSVPEPGVRPAVALEVPGVGSVPLAEESVGTDAGETSYVYGLTVAAGHPEGAGRVAVVLHDAVGNRAGPWTAGPVTVDLTPPTLLPEDVVVSPEGAAGLGRLVEVELASDEVLGAAAIRSEPPGLDLGEAVVAGVAARWTHLVEPADPSGGFDLIVTVADRAGNEQGVLLERAVSLDAVPPGVTEGSVRIGPTPCRDDSVLSVVFETSEPVVQPATVVVGAAGMQALPEGSPTRAAFEHEVDAEEEPEGAHPVVASLQDLAGNTARVSLGTVVYDFTAPRLSGVPSLERCDRLAGARLGANDLWLNRPVCPYGRRPLTASFSLSEVPPEGVDPRVEVAGRGFELDAGASEPPFYVAHLDVSGDEPEATPDRPAGQQVWVESEDPAGNRARLPLGTVRFDHTRPVVAPSEGLLSRVRWVRDPWGSEGSGYQPRMHLTVDGETFSEPGVVRVWAVSDLALPGADPAGEAYGRAEVGAAAFVPGVPTTVEAGASDLARVAFTFTDRAGNESDADPQRGGTQAQPVAAVEWVGTLHGKRVDDPASNPHSLRRGYASGPAGPAADGASEPILRQADYAGAARRGGGVASADTERAGWWSWAAHGAPPAKPGLAMAYDRRRGRLVVVDGDGGGAGCGGPGAAGCSVTWEWDGRAWAWRSPPTSPPAVDTPWLHVDATGRIVMIGGSRAEWVWSWDGHDWRQRAVEAAPPPRDGYAVAYDAGRDVAVLFGGDSPAWGCEPETDDYCGDTWEWDGAGWTARAPDEAPVPRSQPGMVYDGARGVVLLWGGRSFADGACGPPDTQACSDTWLWDGHRWTEVDVPAPPPARHAPSLAYDERRRVVTLFGGESDEGSRCTTGSGVYCSDTWEWDGEAWTRRWPATTPPARASAPMVHDPVRGVSVLLGGACSGGGRRCDELWEWDGEAWRLPEGVGGPGPRSDAAMAPEPLLGSALLFGGLDRGESALADTWRWDGASWTELSVEGGPPARFSHGVAHDPLSGGLLLFGGCAEHRRNPYLRCRRPLGDTWTWDGDAWRAVHPAQAPSPRQGFGIATAPGGAGVVLFGGQDAVPTLWGDTWTWDGASWTVAWIDVFPAPRFDHALAYDAARDVVVLFGGRTFGEGQCGEARTEYCSDTWLWDGAQWTLQEVETVPPPRFHHAMVYDAARRRVVMAGGVSHVGADRASGFPGTWEWDGVDWTEVDPSTEPTPREHPVLGYDTRRGGAILVGGESPQCWEVEGTSQCERTWTRSPHRTRPHLITAFDLRTAGAAERSAADPSGKLVQDVTIRARAGGLGHTWESGHGDGAAVPGFALAVSAFGHGGWLRLAAAPGAGPDAMRDWTGTFDRGWRCGEPWCADATVQQWAGSDGHLHVDLSPLASGGDSPEPARIEADYVELRLRYWRTGCEAPWELLPEGTPEGTPCTDGLPETEGETCRQYRCLAP